MKLVVIAAVAKNGVIGTNNALPWKMPSDLKRFKRLTLGHTIICGRKTYESIGRPLPGRTTAIISRNPEYQVEGCHSYTSLESALWHHTGDQKIFCIGGAQIYKEALEFASELDITRIWADVQGDTEFPRILDEWERVSCTKIIKVETDEFSYRLEKYIRKMEPHDKTNII